MNALASWIEQHIRRGGWDVDLTRTPPTREELKTYQRRARWRLGLALLAILVIARLALHDLPVLVQGLTDAVADLALPTLITGLLAKSIVLIGTAASFVPASMLFGTVIYLLLMAGTGIFRKIDPADDRNFRDWQAARQARPEVDRYQQALCAQGRPEPTAAEVAAARERHVERIGHNMEHAR